MEPSYKIIWLDGEGIALERAASDRTDISPRHIFGSDPGRLQSGPQMSRRWSLPDLAAVAVALVGLGVALYLLRGLFAL